VFLSVDLYIVPLFIPFISQINEFYLQKEAELKLRLETLLSKRRAAAMRGFPDTVDDTTQNNVEWSAVEEGFRHLERDLGKLQVYALQLLSPAYADPIFSNLLKSTRRASAKS
jgi:hypothetical protein